MRVAYPSQRDFTERAKPSHVGFGLQPPTSANPDPASTRVAPTMTQSLSVRTDSQS